MPCTPPRQRAGGSRGSSRHHRFGEHGGVELDGALCGPDAVELAVRGARPGASITLFGALRTTRFPSCGRIAYLRPGAAMVIAVPASGAAVTPIDGAVVVRVDLPEQARGRTTYWQCAVSDGDLPCGLAFTNAVALTPDAR